MAHRRPDVLYDSDTDEYYIPSEMRPDGRRTRSMRVRRDYVPDIYQKPYIIPQRRVEERKNKCSPRFDLDEKCRQTNKGDSNQRSVEKEGSNSSTVARSISSHKAPCVDEVPTVREYLRKTRGSIEESKVDPKLVDLIEQIKNIKLRDD
ncbi:hypothetical protein ACOME3_006532 [Neoechinorhynchus agilis]